MPANSKRRQQADHLPRPLGAILRDQTITAPAALVPGLIVEKSTTLFYAREKLGKTTLMNWVMKQLALGLPIFGQRSEPQTVLFASLEEGMHLVKMRAKEMGVPYSAPIHVLRSVQHGSKPPITILQEAVIATGATVVVIDSLSAYALGSNLGNSAEAWNHALYPLTQLTSTLDFSLVIIHHANKGKGAEDFRGPVAIGAAVNIIAGLSMPKGVEANVRRVRFTGRYRAGDLYVARDPQTGDYHIAENAAANVEVGRGQVTDELLAHRLLEARKVSGGATKDALRKAGGVKATRADAMIEALLAEGRLKKRSVRGGFRYLYAA